MSDLCSQCPRLCSIDRTQAYGFCHSPSGFHVARAALHPWEEPSISGTHGSGTIFFSGCNLRCVFCQNRDISRGDLGKHISDDELIALMLRLQDEGAHNINLVTPSHYANRLADVLTRAKSRLRIPVVYNCGGYESVDTLKQLEGLVEIYLPDFKYYASDLSARYSSAPDYFTVALSALGEMLRQTGKPQIGTDGLMTRGTIVRHLILPTHRRDSIEILQRLADTFGNDAFLLSLMSQYTPVFAADSGFPELGRRITSFEYEAVLKEAERLGFDGYFQSRDSASESFTPNFHETTF